MLSSTKILFYDHGGENTPFFEPLYQCLVFTPSLQAKTLFYRFYETEIKFGLAQNFLLKLFKNTPDSIQRLEN